MLLFYSNISFYNDYLRTGPRLGYLYSSLFAAHCKIHLYSILRTLRIMSDFIESEAEESEEEFEEKDLKPKKTQRFLEDDGTVAVG